MFKKSILLSSSILMAMTVGTTATAQQFEDEIIVTATKRSTTLQETPVAVTVTTSDTIEKAQILDISDLQSVVPSLRVSTLQNSTETNFIIRGFGNGANNAGIEPSVGVFIDGVYRSRSAAQIGDLPKLERVEVLRGPQSTLFGKNASAGVISIVTAKPSFVSEGYVEGTVSNYDGYQGKGYYSGPINDAFAFSIGGGFSKRDGYVDNIGTGNTMNERDRLNVRGQVLWQPADNVEIRVIGDYDKIDEICCYAPNLVNGPTGAAIPLLGGQVVGNPYDYVAATSFDPTNEIENMGVSLHADVDMGSVTMTSITSYRETDGASNGDVDFTNADIIGANADTLDLATFTQELRFATNFDGRFNGVFGGFLFSEDVTQTDGVNFGAAFRSYAGVLAGDPTLFSTLEFLSGTPQGTFFRDGDGVRETSTQDDFTYNLFGQMDFEVTDRLTATLGLAYVDAEKSVSVKQDNTDVYSNTDLRTVNGGIIPQAFFGLGFTGAVTGTPIETFCGSTATPAAVACAEGLSPGISAAITAGVNANLDTLASLQFLPQLIEIPNAIETGRSHDSNVDYSARLAYEVSDSINVYGSYSTGYKATSWNLSRDSRPNAVVASLLFPNGAPFNLVPSTRFAEPEESEVFELGLKTRFNNGSLNLAVFDQTIKNFQSNVFIGTAFTLANAEKQSVKGFEWEGQYRPIDGLTLGSAGTYLDPTYDEFTASAFGDISGTKPAGVAEWSLSTSLAYEFDMMERPAFVRVDHQYESKVDQQDGGTLNPANVALTAAGHGTREVSLFNASAGITLGAVDLSIWGRNLFNDEFITTTFATVAQNGSYNGYANQPRTYGANLRYTFD